MGKQTKSNRPRGKVAAAVRPKHASKAGKNGQAKHAAKPVKKPAPTKSARPASKAPAKPEKTPPVPAGKKPAPKGITIVNSKPVRRPKPKIKLVMPDLEPLLRPGGPKWKPLIPSGPKAPPSPDDLWRRQLDATKPSKIKLSQRELDKYRVVLLRKRSELVGDVSNMEDEALRQNSGSLSSLPQHMAEQGSDAYDQSLSLDLAAVDRNLIREIDDALQRIEDGTYGVCQVTGKRISPERLAELPWARYSIEAAREMERRPYRE